VLIGHSFGGLLLQSLVVEVWRLSHLKPAHAVSNAIMQCAGVFLRNLRGVAFYSVPHAQLCNIAEYVNKLLTYRHTEITDDYCQRHMKELSVDFDGIVNRNNIKTIAFCEGRSLKQVVRMVRMT
jgi:hypothetical protein